MNGIPGKRINPPTTSWWVELLQESQDLEPFIGRHDRCIYVNAQGALVTARKSLADWPRLWRKHFEGVQRLGMFPTVNRRCRFGVIDLDAHAKTSSDRQADATEIMDSLASLGVVAYRETSRSGRGVHLWMFFGSPGVPASDLLSFLGELSVGAREPGHVDTYPNGSRGGGGILLPYFAGLINMLDADLKPVPLDKLESNSLALVPAQQSSQRPTWPPPYMRTYGGKPSARASEFRETLQDGKSKGLVFYRGRLPQARKGFRNSIAGAVAHSIQRCGGTFEDFQRWDAANVPPLATDKPERLRIWWKSALKR